MENNRLLKVKIIKNIGCEEIELGKICDAYAVNIDNEEGCEVFHYSGWWWVPREYCLLVF